MSFTYNRTLSEHFPSGLDMTNLYNDIKNSAITVEYLGSNNTEDIVEIIFQSELSVDELTILNNIISAHNPIAIKPRIIKYTVSPKHGNTVSCHYEVMAVFEYGGSNLLGIINYFDLIAKTDQNNTYSARIYNPQNNTVLAQITGLNNVEYEIIDMGNITNIPTENCKLELQVKSDHDKKVSIQSLIVYHKN
jgi:hypothetical protein